MIKLLFVPLVFAILAMSPAQAADPACRAVIDASAKVFTTPVHLYTSETAEYLRGKTKTSEAVYLSNAVYLQVNGQWRLSKVTPRSLQEARKEADPAAQNATCRVLREESINGETAVVYSIHQQTEDAKIDVTAWISKARGLPIKEETDMDVGGAAGKSHHSVRYDFTNVQAPAGVH